MGLMDVLNGMQNGPRGQRPPSTGTGAPSGGMSPLTMALLGLLAYKAIKSFSGQPGAGPAAPTAPRPAPLPGGTSTMGMNPGGGLGDLLKGGLGGLLAGGAAGGVLSGGLGDLLKQFQDKGHGVVADSWVGTGTNKQISPAELANTLGPEQINTLTSLSGMSRDELLEGLSQHLPEVVDKLTPNGRMPTEQEAAHLL